MARWASTSWHYSVSAISSSALRTSKTGDSVERRAGKWEILFLCLEFLFVCLFVAFLLFLFCMRSNFLQSTIPKKMVSVHNPLRVSMTTLRLLAQNWQGSLVAILWLAYIMFAICHVIMAEQIQGPTCATWWNEPPAIFGRFGALLLLLLLLFLLAFDEGERNTNLYTTKYLGLVLTCDHFCTILGMVRP